MRHRSPAEGRVARLIAILLDLNLQAFTRRQLSTRYAVSERQITKDLAVLRDAGVIISRDRRQGYRATGLSGRDGSPGYLTQKAAARRLGVHPSAISRAMEHGTLGATRDMFGFWRIAADELARYAATGIRAARAITAVPSGLTSERAAGGWNTGRIREEGKRGEIG